MQASGSTHTYAKRGVALEPPLIAGIIVVVVVLNLILAVSWCMIRDRKKLNKLHKRRISAPVDCEKYEHSVAFAITTGAVPKAIPLKDKTNARREQGGKSYYELVRAFQTEPCPQVSSSPTRLSRGSSRTSAEATGLSKFVLRPQDIKEFGGVPVYPKTKGHGHTQAARQSLGVPVRVDLRRANSLAETASVYSSASAPIEYHEQLLRTQPFVLDQKAPNSAPAWISQMPTPPSPAVLSFASILEMDEPPSSPIASISDHSDASTIKPYSHPSPISVSPISVPASSTASPIRSRAYSNPSAPPQVHWLTKKETSGPPAHSKRPNSVSSLSTIFSLRDATQVPTTAPVVVAPLNVRRPFDDTPWESVDLTRSTPLASPPFQPPAPPALAPPPGIPSIPARSPRRPAPSASVERVRAPANSVD